MLTVVVHLVQGVGGGDEGEKVDAHSDPAR